MCEAAQDKVGSRGRMIAGANERVDSGPTWQLLDELAGRGFGITWVGRELGYRGGLQIQRSRPITRRIADAVADLYRDVGDLVMPTLAKSDRRPSLDDLRRAHLEKRAS
jgi:hypothetical protein